jgi:uncharacterized membrane protein YagU involved in acid resistance
MPRLHPDDLLISAAAGVVATVPMTITMEELHRVMPGEHDGPLPPREVTEGVVERLDAEREMGEEQLERMTLLLHYAFGGAAGAVFPLIAPRGLVPAVGAGMVYGLTVWSGSYLGVLPALGVRHHARHDSAGRTAIMIAAHVVWGATLGLLLRAKPGLRTASRHPDRDASAA